MMTPRVEGSKRGVLGGEKLKIKRYILFFKKVIIMGGKKCVELLQIKIIYISPSPFSDKTKIVDKKRDSRKKL